MADKNILPNPDRIVPFLAITDEEKKKREEERRGERGRGKEEREGRKTRRV